VNICKNPRHIFLTDGLGALVSTVSLVVVASLETLFGMPKAVLFKLMPIAAVLMACSLSCYLIQPKSWTFCLTLIAIANILYSCVIAALVLYHFHKLTALGVTYFFIEILILIFLSGIELRLTSYKQGQKN
jgi:hypothetical protein